MEEQADCIATRNREVADLKARLVQAEAREAAMQEALEKIADSDTQDEPDGSSIEIPRMNPYDMWRTAQAALSLNAGRAVLDELNAGWTGLRNLYRMITEKDCDQKVALGMATSAVSALLERTWALEEVARQTEKYLDDSTDEREWKLRDALAAVRGEEG